MTFSSIERAGLAQLFHLKGPDAPTLCEGWTTRDLAAHLWVREHHTAAQLGQRMAVLSNLLEKRTDEALARDFDELVDAWAAGPRGLNPWRLLDPVANSLEHFIHHEDVRRGGWAPGDPVASRELPREYEQILHRTISLIGSRILAPTVPVILLPEGLPRIVIGDKPGVAEHGDDVVRIDAPMGELALWVCGRDAVDVAVSGSGEAIVRSGL
ncbi:TIGR03085 family metal-binding protein [Corynebacterium pacaense]|uniref:TIGR03085 family metal-binding protein n=1 Tax=Corynebacterium pacaense TaxID=1816684 RepID=UPI0009BA5D99|nr:TIGR03085 family metal-binding protein [Corynebacterium pacaense]